MDLLDGIYTRRSIRYFTDEPVDKDHLIEMIKAGTWAPSGLNNQPWRFVIINDRAMLIKLSSLTKYKRIIEESRSCIAVYVDKKAMYNDVKDHQAIGACIQNMLLAAHALGLGSVWLGEILNKSDSVNSLLDISDEMGLMAVIAIGHPADRKATSKRRDISEVILKEI
ncbi:MAG: nitroreductase [Nitrospirota bacterium]|nr:MAG: nitroreductase [Nitrospirota bacterium]